MVTRSDRPSLSCCKANLLTSGSPFPLVFSVAGRVLPSLSSMGGVSSPATEEAFELTADPAFEPILEATVFLGLSDPVAARFASRAALEADTIVKSDRELLRTNGRDLSVKVVTAEADRAAVDDRNERQLRRNKIVEVRSSGQCGDESFEQVCDATGVSDRSLIRR